MKSVIQAAFLLCLPCVITALCTFQRNPREGMPFCPVDKPIQFLWPGEFYRDFETCMNVSCDQNGLHFCGYGIGAGDITVPPECRLEKLEDCDYRIVKEDNEDESCFEDQQPKVQHK